MILGLPLSTFILFALPIVTMVVCAILIAIGWYEGKDVEEKYDVDEWYHTF